uniref:Integral membrane protein n=1 Tax=uncultured bacterium Contig16 TaxID=1393468 RepID=W0FKL3_9BACT|nr:hypothetical protein [uncultured bacterium Contig16]
MKQLFAPDSKLMIFLGIVKDLMLLGLIFIVTALPVVTFGAAMTALQYTALKMARDEESGVFRDYFRSFRLNLRQSTAIWTVYLVFLTLTGWSIFVYFANPGEFPVWLLFVLIGVACLLLMFLICTFAIQSKFDNPIRKTIRYGLIMAFSNLFRSILMLILYLVPAFLGWYFYEILPLTLIFGFSLPAYVSARWIYGKRFLEMENKILAKTGTAEPGADQEDRAEQGAEQS